jgi:hypothetical protein
VDERAVVAPDLVPELADGLEERQRLDVADGPADLDDDEVGVLGLGEARMRDLISSVMCGMTWTVFPGSRPALLGDHGRVDGAGRDVRAAWRSLVVNRS